MSRRVVHTPDDLRDALYAKIDVMTTSDSQLFEILATARL
jgi:hypothetical protein